MQKVFAELGYPGYPAMRVCYADHCFGGMDSNRRQFLILTDEVIEKQQALFRFAGEESG